MIAHLFDMVRLINLVKEGKETIAAADREMLANQFRIFANDILGLRDDRAADSGNQLVPGLIELILDIRQGAKTNKDFALSDRIRNELNRLGVTIRDGKNGAEWEI
jgi:cysteinyl-tRNA synthetase